MIFHSNYCNNYSTLFVTSQVIVTLSCSCDLSLTVETVKGGVGQEEDKTLVGDIVVVSTVCILCEMLTRNNFCGSGQE